MSIWRVGRGMSPAPLYPSYVDLDPYIDVARLRALEPCLRERLQQRIDRERDLRFYTGPFLLREDEAAVPGARMVALSRSSREEVYLDLDRTELWEPSEEAAEFPELMAFIETLPFKARGRMLIIYDQEGRAVTAHRDHDLVDLCHEFIWFRTNLAKPFFMLDPQTGERRDVESYCAWFDTVNQYHGADATGELAWSIRVDGVFSDEFRARIPVPAEGRSAAAAHWAASLAGA
jgi:hypothetical protein